MIWKERGGKMKKTQKPGKNKKTNAVIVILLGLLCAVSTVKSCATKRAAIQNIVDDVVYVGQGSYDPANDGKIVIVCGVCVMQRKKIHMVWQVLMSIGVSLMACNLFNVIY